MNYQPEIAIVEANTLTCLGLKGSLSDQSYLWLQRPAPSAVQS